MTPQVVHVGEGDAGRDAGEDERIAIGERKLLDAATIDDLPQGGRPGLQQVTEYPKG